MKTAAIYIRTSKEYKDREKVSVPQQLEDGKILGEKNGLTISDEHLYIDADIPAKFPPAQWRIGQKGKVRQGLSALIEAIEAGEVKSVITRKRDRLFRKTEWAIKFYDLCKTHKVPLLCTHESLPVGNDASGLFALTVLSAAAEFELGKMSENQKAGKAYAKRHGLKMFSGKIIFGFNDGERGKIVVDEEQARVVKEIFKRFLAGSSIINISKWLKKDHPDLRAKNLNPKWKWHVTTVRKILSNIHYVGLTRGENGDVLKNDLWPSIIDNKTFNEAQEILKSRSVSHGKPVYHLLSGFLKCGYCGDKLSCYSRYHAKTGKKTGVEYKCPNKHDGEHPLCMRASEWVRWYEHFFAKGKHDRKPVETDKMNELKLKASTLESNASSYEDLLASGDMTPDQFAKVNKATQVNLSKIKQELAALQAVSGPAVYKPWEDKTLDEKRQDVAATASSIKVYRREVVVESVFGKYTFPLMLCRTQRHVSKPMHVLCHPKPQGGVYFKGPEVRVKVVRWKPQFLSRDFRYVEAGLNPIQSEKPCSECGKMKPLTAYALNRRAGENGRCAKCKACQQKYRKTHAVRIKAYKKSYRMQGV